MPVDTIEQGSYSYDWLMIDTIRLMRNAQADGQLDKYFSLFDYALKMAIPWLSSPTRKGVQKDYETYQARLEEIKKNESLNEASKEYKIRELKADFADAHKILIFAALPRMGIVKVSEEGAIKFDTLDIDQIAAIVRSSTGTLKKIAEVRGEG